MHKTFDSQDLHQIRQLIVQGTGALGISLSPRQLGQFIAYLDLIQLWNSKFNLTAIRNTPLIIRHHFIDSLAIARFINPHSRLVDIGSGAGFPGIPLKIIFPDKEITLVDSQRKKTTFMREVVRDLELRGIEVSETRAEKIKPLENSQYAEAVARAFGSLDQFLKISASLLAPGGRSLFMSGPKGPNAFTKIRGKSFELGFVESQIENYLLPIGEEGRTLLIFSKN